MSRILAIAAIACVSSAAACTHETKANNPSADAGAQKPVAADPKKTDAALDPKKVESSTGITFDVPEGWKRIPPKTNMRVAELTPPRAEGDTDEGNLVVTYFGGGAGGFEANLDRWAGQMTKADGTALGREDAKIRDFAYSAAGKAKIVEFEGNFDDPGMASRLPIKFSNAKLVVAAVEREDGTYYFKLVGPAKSIAAAVPGFEALLKSIKFTN
jgi:hypothetical protein